ncbi:MAG: aspartyl/glutamyl-tRNA(Asn/Gln) amidotransferase subunit B [Gemmatales bacterium]|nr:MAG: aspartyl/glutamyl-tRNA(Asn/Gln) amidotransferase subunit B [Gemmatales bacterium]
MKHHLVIGLEVHVQLLTRTKLFCGCRNQFGLPPNSATCPVCLGLPGVLPVMNRRAFELAVKAALALNCEIPLFTKWDRKNYYYPDLPKNYQISQYDLPLSRNGWLDVESPAGNRRIGIIRVHLEEDAGKLTHDEQGKGDSLVDLNRTGTPLLEIVSRPDIVAPEEAKAYLEEIRLLMRELEISDCEMQEGSLRCDANINVHVAVPDGCFAATPIVEIKNLNSFRAVERALKYEASRQIAEFEKKFGKEWQIREGQPREFAGRLVCPVMDAERGQPIPKATAGWNEDRGVTVVQRSKEEAEDYRYLPDPDLVPVVVDPAWLDEMRSQLGELPAAQRRRLQADYALTAYEAGVLTAQGRALVAYFEETAQTAGDPKEASNWIINDLLQVLNESKRSLADLPLKPRSLGGLIRYLKQTGLNKQRGRDIFARMLEKGIEAEQAAGELGIQVVGDESELAEIVRRAIAANPKAVADYKNGKKKAADAIKGAIMRETKGMARIEVVQRLLLEELEKVPSDEKA